MASHQKKAAKLKSHIVFIDESGMLMAPLVRRTWSPRGQTPILYQRTCSHNKVSVVGAVCIAPQRNLLSMYFRLHLDFFPPYAPELNPVEYVWAHTKMNPMANMTAMELDALAKNTRGNMRSLQKKQPLLRSFFKKSGLFYALNRTLLLQLSIVLFFALIEQINLLPINLTT